MAGSLSNYASAKMLDYLFGNTAYTAPATLYFALTTTTPSDATSGTEVTGGSYARVAVTNNSTNFPAASVASPASKTNGTAITFPAPTANWGTIVGVEIYDASTSGNRIAWADVPSQAVNNGDPAPKFNAAALTFTTT